MGQQSGHPPTGADCTRFSVRADFSRGAAAAAAAQTASQRGERGLKTVPRFHAASFSLQTAVVSVILPEPLCTLHLGHFEVQ